MAERVLSILAFLTLGSDRFDGDKTKSLTLMHTAPLSIKISAHKSTSLLKYPTEGLVDNMIRLFLLQNTMWWRLDQS